MTAKFRVGDRVQLADQRAKVGVILHEPREQAETFYYQVFFSPTDQDTQYPESALQPHAGFDSFSDAFAAGNFLDRSRFLQFLILEKIRRPLSDNIYTFYASRTDFQVYQFKPVLKFLGSVNQRLFLGDEVGLGKTIETGIILTELEARLRELSRVLVVCPAALTEKWELELRRRFEQSFRVLDRGEFRQFLDRFERYGEAEKIRAICSLQMLRNQGVLERLSRLNVHFDLVIIDESHHLKNPETNSSWLGEVLSENADAMVMLSATPLHLGTEDLFNQLRILCPEDFPEFDFFERLIEPNAHINAAIRQLGTPQLAAQTLRVVEDTHQRDRFLGNPNYQECLSALESRQTLDVSQAVSLQRQLTELNTLSHLFTRTKRRDIVTEVHFPQREAHVIDVEFTDEEMEVYDAVTEWVIRRYWHSQLGIAFAKIMPQRQVASCIPAMKGYLKDLLEEGRIRGPRADDGDEIDLGHEGDDDPLEKAETASVQRLLNAVDRVGSQDTKFDRFLEALLALREKQPRAKILVFSYFKRTLAYLLRKLTSHGIAATVIHGDIGRKERQQRIRRFWRDDDLPVLLSSEVGGEGLDFQIANVMVNYDLPWNPMRVEQRIGRLDRFGQTHEKILIYNFSMKGTIDDIILSRLYSRINIFERYIGDLEAILGDRINELTREMLSPEVTEEERQRKADKISENLVRKQEELERFERQSEKFIGQDEFFTREISRIRETKRFITPEEVRFLLETFIAENCTATTLKPPKSGRSEVFVLKANQEFRGFLHAYAPADNAKKEMLRQLDRDEGALVTFSSTEASRDDNLIFVTIHSPLIKAILAFAEAAIGDAGLPLGQLRLTGYQGLEGAYFLFVYLLEKSGAKTTLQLVPILINAEDTGRFHVSDDITERLLGGLMQAEDPEVRISFAPEDVRAAEAIADESITMLREEEEQSLRRANEVLVNNRIESIRQTLGLKEQRIRQTIQKVKQRDGDARIVRLHEGRFRNLQEAADAEVAKWEARRPVSVGYRRVAAAVVSFS